MILFLAATVLGLIVLVWSADWFVEGAAVTARHIGAPPLLIGIVIVGFGTSVPEMVVSMFSSLQGNPGLALGNAYGSNIANIGFILGLTALISPVLVHSDVLRKELPLLCIATVPGFLMMLNGMLSRLEAAGLLLVLAAIMSWSIRHSMRTHRDRFIDELEAELVVHDMPLKAALVRLILGLLLLVGSSRVLVWGAVGIATSLGVSDVIIGLTVVAFGTSLPELAASLAAIRKGEHDIIMGNIMGSNLFNTLAVVGIAGVARPVSVAPEVLYRDYPVMTALTLLLFLFGYGFGGREARINRWMGAFLFVSYVCYVGWLARETMQALAGQP